MTRKNIIITGASSGLGREMARQFAQKGRNLAICARRTESLESLKKELLVINPEIQVEVAELDVNNHDQVFEVFKQFKSSLGGIDRAILNAGMGKGASLGTGYFHANKQTAETNFVALIAQSEAALEIMRDSRIGTYGTVTLGLVLALKATVLTSLAVSDAVVAVILAHIVSRAATVQIVSIDSYEREVGAKFVAPTVAPGAYRFAMLTGTLTLFVGAVWFGIGAILVAVGVAVIAAGVFRAMVLRKLQGYTGDCLGAIQQLSELGLYLGLALWL